MKLPIYKFQKRGFALLFAVLAASLLLSIGLSIFNITVKELALSSAGRESQFSFYASDSGAECGLYYDLKSANIIFATSSTSGSAASIVCGNATLTLNITASNSNSATTTFAMPLNDALNKNYCSAVTVAKRDPDGDGLSATVVDARGYNICDANGNPAFGNPNLVERALKVSY